MAEKKDRVRGNISWKDFLFDVIGKKIVKDGIFFCYLEQFPPILFILLGFILW